MFFFFFKQKTAYEIMPSLVGSEMCIRDRVYLRDADGSWRKVDTTEDGSYLVFTAMTDETTLAAVEKPGIPLPILIGGAVAAVLLVILSILGHKHRKKRLTKKAEQERKRAEETENG